MQVRHWNKHYLLLLTGCLFLSTSPPAFAESLHTQIDVLIQKGAKQHSPAQRTTDALFARRLYLDLAGRIPTVPELKTFLKDKRNNKRELLIDQLLKSDDYPRRMQELFHVMLMERRGDHEEWTTFLKHAFEQNRPWNKIAADILDPPVDKEDRRGAGYFFTSRLVKEGAMASVDVPAVTRDVGRLFAGVDLQCAQCHDHMTVDDYQQRDFQGLHVVFENLATRRDVKFPAVSEKLLRENKSFQSVFGGETMKVGLLVPGGEEIPIPNYTNDEVWKVPPDRKKRTPGIPKFSPLEQLSQQLTASENELFRRNIVNRLWFQMMGRGLIMPLDLIHNQNPASHPALLKLLEAEFVKQNFNIQWFLKEIALSETYQRSSMVTKSDTVPEDRFLVGIEKRLSAEQLFWSVLIATGEVDRHWKEDPSKPSALSEIVNGNEQLKELQGLFVKTFANPPKVPEVEFAPSVKGALFLMNDPRLLRLLERKPGNLIDRLCSISDEEQMIEELFLTVLSRPPTKDDVTDISNYLKEAGSDDTDEKKAISLGQIIWALLSTTEFCLNH